MKKPVLPRSKFRKKFQQFFFKVHFKKIEKIKWILKIIFKTTYLEKQFKILAIFYLINFVNKSSISKQKNTCLISSWYKSVNPTIKLNRLTLIDNASKLYIPGIMNFRK